MGRNASSALALPSPSNLDVLVEELRADGRLGRQLVYSTFLPAAATRFGDLNPALPAPLARALGRTLSASPDQEPRLWSHQAEGIAAVRRGEDVLITTPTASGKSLVFQVPPLEEAIAGGPGRALFLFPLKALGQDQRGKFRRLAEEAGLPPDVAGCEIYDGDTPRALREQIRRDFPRVVVSNPDMLHLGVLGHWVGWRRKGDRVSLHERVQTPLAASRAAWAGLKGRAAVASKGTGFRLRFSWGTIYGNSH